MATKKAAPKKAKAPKEPKAPKEQKSKKTVIDEFANIRNSVVTDKIIPKKEYLVYVENSEEEIHLIDVRRVPDDVLNTIEGLNIVE